MPDSSTTSTKVFISYRRNDTMGYATHLHHRLRQFFDEDAVFFDVDSLEGGDSFPERIRTSINGESQADPLRRE